MNDKEKLLKQRKSLQNQLDDLLSSIELVRSQIQSIDDEIESLGDDDYEYKDNLIKDLITIFEFEWENDKTKKKVTNSYISEKLLENGAICDDYSLKVYNRSNFFEALYYDPRFFEVIKGIAFIVVPNENKYYVFMAVVASDPVSDKEKESIRNFTVFKDIKYKSKEYELIEDDYLSSRIIVMTRYTSKYNYTDGRILNDMAIFYKFAIKQAELLTKEKEVKLDYFCRVLPNLLELLCEHTMVAMKIRIPFLESSGAIVYGGPYKALKCKRCDTYYIDHSLFDSLKRSPRGIPLIRQEEKEATGGSGDLQAESILHICGYNVSKNDGYTDQQRQSILRIIIERKLLEKTRIEGYLQFYIRLNKSNPTKRDAIAKWTKDLLFLEALK